MLSRCLHSLFPHSAFFPLHYYYFWDFIVLLLWINEWSSHSPPSLWRCCLLSFIWTIFVCYICPVSSFSFVQLFCCLPVPLTTSPTVGSQSIFGFRQAPKLFTSSPLQAPSSLSFSFTSPVPHFLQALGDAALSFPCKPLLNPLCLEHIPLHHIPLLILLGGIRLLGPEEKDVSSCEVTYVHRYWRTNAISS